MLTNRIRLYKIITFENIGGTLTKQAKEEYVAEYDEQGNKTRERSYRFITGRDIIISDRNEVLKFNRYDKKGTDKLAEIKYVYRDNKPIEIDTFYLDHWKKQQLEYNEKGLLCRERSEEERKGLIQETLYRYHSSGLLKEIEFTGAQEHTFTKFHYNLQQQLSQEVYSDADGAEIMRYLYKYDGEGNMIELFLYALGDKNNKRERRLITRNVRQGFNETVMISIDYESGREERSKVCFLYDDKVLREEVHYNKDNQVSKVKRHVIEYF